MKNPIVKFSPATKEVEQVVTVQVKSKTIERIDEEVLFTLFTANIIKANTTFTR